MQVLNMFGNESTSLIATTGSRMGRKTDWNRHLFFTTLLISLSFSVEMKLLRCSKVLN